MRKSKWIIWVITLTAVISLLAGMYYYMGFGKRPTEKKAISIIVYGSNSERWDNLRNGAEQASYKLSAEVNLVTMSDETDVTEQKKLLQREIDGGADALMIAACDSAVMKAEIESMKSRIPILMVESGIGDSEEYLTINSNNYNMGKQLGEEIVKRELPESKVAIICDHDNRDSVMERYHGMVDALTGKVDSVVYWGRKDNEQDLRAMLFLQRELTEEAVDVVVALDTSSTDAIIDAVENLGKDVKIYGIGNSDKAIYYLDKESMEALGYQNEYSIGYLGVEQLMGVRNNTSQEYEKMIDYQVITKKNMYETSHQKMLFPFVK